MQGTGLSKVRPGQINDVVLIPLPSHIDDRGYLFEIARVHGSEGSHSVVHQFGQVYLVGDPVRGTARAFHKHRKLWDFFCISHGSAKFVLVDDRENSSTRNVMSQFVLSGRNPSLLVVPPGVYHGWMSLEDDTQMVSIASEPYDAENPDETRIPPDSCGDVWTVVGR